VPRLAGLENDEVRVARREQARGVSYSGTNDMTSPVSPTSLFALS
jgi:hypothetical protein